MKLDKLQKKLIEISKSSSIQEIDAILEDFKPDRNNSEPPDCFSINRMDYPGSEFFEKGYDLNSVITCSHGTDGDGPCLGYHYYKNIPSAVECEIKMSLSGIFHVWRDIDEERLHTDLFSIITKQSVELLKIIKNLQETGTIDDLNRIAFILEKLEERTFITFSTIIDHVRSWAKNTPRYIHYEINLPNEYERIFGKKFSEITLQNIQELAWVSTHLPSSDWGI